MRVMTYNAHSCIGTDGQLSPRRIADVIAHSSPDVVALQELEVGRARTGRVDQAQRIAEYLEMDFHFHPAVQFEEERFGDAILSRLPMRLRHAGPLPAGRSRIERRGALWTTITANDQEIQMLNTHLGLRHAERIAQTEALFGPEWLGSTKCQPPMILCGDFNSLPGSRVHRRCLRTLRDVHRCLAVQRPRRTYPTRYPLISIDHVFLSAEFHVHHVEVPRTALTRVASDHFPLIVELTVSP
jgi:endonuclease/exonuclease/phosphatase family metal-dependent hydrolase